MPAAAAAHGEPVPAVLAFAAPAAAAAAPLAADFTIEPAAPQPGQPVTFTNTSTGGSGTITPHWDLDDDGEYDNGTTPTVTRTFAAGQHTVRLLVTSVGPTTETDSVSKTFTVAATPTPTPTATPTPSPQPPPGANQAPQARIDLGCASPRRGTQLCLNEYARIGAPKTFDASPSHDADGQIVRYEWDLDGDGSFETDTGAEPRATRTYGDPDPVTVRLRVTDDRGATGETQMALKKTQPACERRAAHKLLSAVSPCFRHYRYEAGDGKRIARPDGKLRVPLQLLATEPAGEAWVVEALERGAAAAAGPGARETAVALLRRALDEPPPPERRPQLLAALGTAERHAMAPEAPARLESALAVVRDADARAELAVELAAAREPLGQAGEALTLLEQALAHHDARAGGLTSPQGALLEAQIHAVRLVALLPLPDEDRARGRTRLTQADPALVETRYLAGVLAYDEATRGGTAQRALAFARLALEPPLAPEALGAVLAMVGATCAGAPELVLRNVDLPALARARRRSRRDRMPVWRTARPRSRARRPQPVLGAQPSCSRIRCGSALTTRS